MVTRILALALLTLAAAPAGRADENQLARERAKAALVLATLTTPSVALDVNGRDPKQAAKAALAQACGLPCDCGVCPDGKCPKMPPAVKPCFDCAPCVCEKCGCELPTAAPKFVRVEPAKADPLTQLFRDVQAGRERVVYLGYNPPKGDAKAVALDKFAGEKKGVFECFLQGGECKYRERPDLIPMKDVTRTERVQVCENGVCRLVDRPVTARVPDEK